MSGSNMARYLSVAFVVDDLEERGGTELHLLTLCRGLVAGGHRCTVVCTGRDGLLPEFRREGVATVTMRTGRVLGPRYLAHVRSLARVLADAGAHVVEAVHTAADLIAPPAAAALGIPCVSSRRDLGIFRKPWHRLGAKLVAGLVAAYVAPSHAVVEAVARAEGIAASRFVIIPNGVDDARFRPRDPGPCRARLGIPGSALVIGNVSALTPTKRPMDLVRAFQWLLAKGLDVHLVLAGAGPMAPAIEVEAASTPGRVHLLGEVDRPEDVYPCLDVLVLPSASEGLSNTLLEAMACGLPVVATDVGGNPEVVEPRVNGLLVPLDHPEALAEAIMGLLRSPEARVRMGRAARSTIQTRYQIKQMVKEHERLFQVLASVPGATRWYG